MDRLGNLIKGEVVAPAERRYSQLIDPTTGVAYMEAPLSTEADVDAACLAASEAFKTWRRTTPAERSLALFRIADAIAKREDEIVEAEAKNTGKPYSWLREIEFPGIVENIRFFAAAARDLRGLSAGAYVSGHESLVRREPLGVVGQVSPWNYPLQMGVWKFGPALAAGNTVVLKPSDTTPVTTLLAGQIMAEFLPAGVFNVVIGDRNTGRALVDHPTPVLISVTGSERAGQEVSAAAASDLKRVHLELGGKAPAIVFSDADLQATVKGIAFAGFLNAGQDCEASTRVLVERTIYDEFVELLVKEAENTKYGAPGEDVAYGPLNSRAQLERVQGYVDRRPARSKILTGGSPDRRNGGFYYPPTVIVGLEQQDELIQEEVFGPVITVQAFEDEDEALRMANDVRFGLAASLWTNDHNRVLRLSGDLDFGKVWVNTHLEAVADMPNNGYKHSGNGNDLSVFAIEEYTRIKHVMSRLPE